MSGTTVRIDGKPKMALTFFDLITWNRFSNLHHKSKMGVAAKARAEGMNLAWAFQERMNKNWDWFDDKVMVDRVLLIIKVYPPPTEERSDTHNVCIKNTIDGFSDAKVWEDDEWAYVPLTMFMWAGIDTDPQYKKKRARRGKIRRIAPSRRTVIEVHRLDALIINGQGQTLPAGRERI